MAEQYQIQGENAAGIVASVETGVRTGALPPGAALPPVRRLAARLTVATATVAGAYRTLRQRGIVETAGRNGTHVRPRPALTHRGPAPLPDGVLDLSSGEPDTTLLPDLATALRRVHPAPGGYCDAGPCPGLVDQARIRLAADGVHGDITITGGALDGIDRVLSAQLEPGDTVAIEDPAWANLRDLIAALGMRAAPVPVDRDGPTAQGLSDALRAGARAVVITSRAHNPTGAVISGPRAAELRDVLRQHRDVLVVEDDHWAELSDDPLHLVADVADHWLFLRSVSKPFGPDLRVAIGCGDESTIARVEGRMRLGSGWVSTVLQQIVLGLMQDPATETVVRQAAQTYRERREQLLAALAQRGVTAIGHTGLNVWVPVEDETTTVTLLRDAGFAVAPGTPNRIDSPPGVRITIAPLAPEEITPLADAMARATHSTRQLV